MSQDKRTYYTQRKRLLYKRWQNYLAQNDGAAMYRIEQRIIDLNHVIASMKAA